MVPNMAMYWIVWNRNKAKVGSVSIQTAEGTWLGVETILVEHRILRAGVDRIGARSGDIGNGSGVYIL